MVVDGKAGAKYDAIGEGAPIFSPDGKRVAYAAQKGAKLFVVVDGKAGAEYDTIGGGTLVFSPDGKRVAYGARKGANWLVVVDGQEGAEYAWIGTLSFSPGGVLEYLATKEESLYRIRYEPSLQ
ncbi:MAG TPA: hypothetical protein VEV41_01865 [Terriglobales bacterium]|nr:hypothetical protein [Terriglobales bacterium]